jgi:hypothetical protein
MKSCLAKNVFKPTTNSYLKRKTYAVFGTKQKRLQKLFCWLCGFTYLQLGWLNTLFCFVPVFK